jgi:pSer/pThr/pTyr-binding forkhead associated (FHA) protein
MGERLSRLLDHAATRAAFWNPPAPVLLWEGAPPPRTSPELLWVTNPKIRIDRPGNDPLIYRIEKSQRGNAFALGITLGRATNNDIVVDDPSVSRFHGYLVRDEHTKVWHMVDAESSAGTFCAGERLAPRRPAPLVDGEVIRVGLVDLTFLSPEALERYLRRWEKGPGPHSPR